MALRVEIPPTHKLISDPRYRRAANLFYQLNHRVNPETGKVWAPNEMQQKIGQAFFVDGKRRGMVVCGRKAGKTDVSCDLMWRFGNLINNGQIYYFAAEQAAAKEIVWSNQRLQSWGPADYLMGKPNETEMRIRWKTGTFAKVDGADNFRGKKGFNPNVVILDEGADYPRAFWDVMNPNFAAKDCIVLIITSPPWEMEEEPGKPTLFMRMVDLYQKHPNYFYLNYPSHVNEQNLPEGFLQREERDLLETGQKDIWEREYLAKFIKVGGTNLIPTFSKERHMKPHAFVIDKLRKGNADFELTTSIDPGKVFAASFMAINQYSKEVLWLDEIYEKEIQNQMVEVFWPRVRQKQIELCGSEDPDRWLNQYDEAERWFMGESTLRFSNPNDLNFCQISPTDKQRHPVEDGLSMLRTIFAYNLGYLSDRCKWTAWEFENYRRNERGKIPENAADHIVDSSRYNLHALEYNISSEDRPEMPAKGPFSPREPSLEEDLAEMLGEEQDYIQSALSMYGDMEWRR